MYVGYNATRFCRRKVHLFWYFSYNSINVDCSNRYNLNLYCSCLVKSCSMAGVAGKGIQTIFENFPGNLENIVLSVNFEKKRFSSLSKEILREEVENIPLSQIRKWDDVPKLAAFMYECIRWNPVIHRNLFHSSTRNIEVGGFSFSKDTLFSFNVAGWRWQTICILYNKL